jgi:nickel transport protein
MRTRFFVLLVATGAVALSPSRASAHDLRLVVKLPPESPDVLIAEGAFDDDTPADEAKVTITDANGEVIAEAKTDERGTCKFTRPAPGKYTAKIVAFGHRDKIEFEVAEVAGPMVEYRGWRPDKTIGLATGVGGLLVVSGSYWWFRGRKVAVKSPD